LASATDTGAPVDDWDVNDWDVDGWDGTAGDEEDAAAVWVEAEEEAGAAAVAVESSPVK
jgi:hypothetical protein